MKKLLIANWKMNLGCEEGAKLALKFSKLLTKNKNKDYVILPSLQSILFIRKKLSDSSINIGAQDCSQFAFGAYTGDVSASMIKEIGCKYVLLGHSERRLFHSENKKILKAKIINAISNSLKIIYCVGEQLKDYKKSNTKNVIKSQILSLFSEEINFKNIIIAYEPVWAIGTKKTPTVKEINSVHEYIKNLFLKVYKIKNICVLYGGSVNFNNSKEIFSAKYVDGGLIGGASLKADEFKKIYDNLN